MKYISLFLTYGSILLVKISTYVEKLQKAIIMVTRNRSSASKVCLTLNLEYVNYILYLSVHKL